MSPRLYVSLAFAALACCVLVASGVGATAQASNESVRLAGVYPNPVADGDAGEFVVLDVSGPTSLDGWVLADSDRQAPLPNRSVGGRLAFSSAPNVTRNVTDTPVVPLPDGPQLANGGERLVLRHGGHTVDTISYTDAPEGELATATGDGLAWEPVGATDYSVTTGGSGHVRAFVLPDSPGIPVETLQRAESRLLLAGYTLTSRRVADALVAARERGIDVAVLVDGNPVGGLTRRQASVLDRLTAANVSVTVLTGEAARYRYHHAKYAIADGRALVTTENWKPAGTGGHGSRGWGVVVRDARVVEGLADTFTADSSGRDGVAWPRFREGQSFEHADAPPANSSFPTRFPAERVRTERVELLAAPDNAERRVVSLVGNATESVRVQQVSVGGRSQPFLSATLQAARRGAEVKVLLSDAWYVREENRALVAWLNGVADSEDLPLSARVADPGGRYEKIHAKGVLVDGDSVLVGSLNWNNNSARQNREVALLLHGESVAGYYRAVFRADWLGGIWTVPVGLLVTVVLAAAVAVAVGRRITFESEREPGVSAGRG